MTIEKQQELVKKLIGLRKEDVTRHKGKFKDTMMEVLQAVADDVQKAYGTMQELLIPFYLYEFECVVEILKKDNPGAEEIAKILHNMIGYTVYSSEQIVEIDGRG